MNVHSATYSPSNLRLLPTTVDHIPVSSSIPASQPSASSSAESTPTNYHILLVEDNLINQKVLSKQLRGIGCTVHVANHGGEALDFLTKTTRWMEPFGDTQRVELALILMDLEMPVMDGLTCTRGIRDREREGKLRGHVPIIAVTANTRMEQMNFALEAGMVGLHLLLWCLY